MNVHIWQSWANLCRTGKNDQVKARCSQLVFTNSALVGAQSNASWQSSTSSGRVESYNKWMEEDWRLQGTVGVYLNCVSWSKCIHQSWMLLVIHNTVSTTFHKQLNSLCWRIVIGIKWEHDWENKTSSVPLSSSHTLFLVSSCPWSELVTKREGTEMVTFQLYIYQMGIRPYHRLSQVSVISKRKDFQPCPKKC